ncbi:MAG: ABC transporter substrate-binding protein [Spirochaetes bacterium]|nr:ABC transporter substrate-binding protein [Spirochaetota bacterium]
MKKNLIYSVIFVLILFAAAGCSKTDGQKDGIKNVTIWYYWETEKHQKTLNKIISDFNESQTQIVVKAEYIPFAEFKKQLSIGTSAAKLPDIVIIDNPDHASYSAMGIFADITEKMKDWTDLNQYFEGPLNSCKLDGKLYGIPFGSNCLALYYNEDMMKAANASVPQSWDELRAVSKKLTKGSVKGLGFSSLPNEEGTFNFLTWVWSTGTSAFGINNPEGIKSLAYVSDLVKDGSVPKEAINWTQGDVMHQFISGNLAMMINGPWQIPTMRQEAPKLNWNVALIPKDKQYASDLGGENFGVVNGQNVDASLEFIKFACEPDRIKTYINDFGYIASRKDVAETQFAEDDKIMKLFAEEMQYALPRGPHAKWPEISNAISLAFNEVMTGVSSPADAAKKAQKTIDSIIK